MSAAVRSGFHPTRAAGLEGSAGVVQPHIATAHEHSADLDVVVFNKNQVALQLAVLGEMGDFLDEPLAVFIGGMRLAGEDELHRPLGVLGEFHHFLEVIKNKRGSFVGCKASGEADGQCVGIQQMIVANEVAFARGRIVNEPPSREIDQLAPQSIAQSMSTPRQA